MISLGLKQKNPEFPVFSSHKLPAEYALARREKFLNFSEKGVLCETENVTLEEDLSRRDFTINAIAFNKEYYDPFCGRKDLEKNLLKPLNKFFDHDPLRFWRLSRFACLLQCSIDSSIEHYSYKGDISLEKKEQEILKILTWKDPSQFFLLLSRFYEKEFKNIPKKFLHSLQIFQDPGIRILLIRFFFPESLFFASQKNKTILQSLFTKKIHSFQRKDLFLLREYLLIQG
jgi:tRNA nucleotidyltransferase/poly(A) polymerase